MYLASRNKERNQSASGLRRWQGIQQWRGEDPDRHQTGERGTGTGNLVVGRACLGIFRGLLACLLLRARRGAVGGSIAATFRRSVVPSPALPCCRTCFLHKSTRIFTSSALLLRV
jgi:hypothetical protein